MPLRVGITKKVFSIFLLLYLLFTAVTFSLAAEKPVTKRVLIIYSYHEGLPWDRLMDNSLRATLVSKSTEPIGLNVEHADLIRYLGDGYLQKLVDLFRHKYSHPKMDVVIAMFAFAVAIIGLLWLLRLKKRQSSPLEPSEADLFKQFHRASTSSDAAKIMQALMRWLDRSGLTGVSGRLDLLVSRADDADLGLQVQALETVLFSPGEINKGAGSWSAGGLYRAVKRARKKLGQADIRLKAGEEGLPALNP